MPEPIRPPLFLRWTLPLCLTVSLGLAAAVRSGFMGANWLLLPLGAILVLVTIGVVVQRSGIFGQPLLAVRTERPEVALTFDDGPDPEITRAVMDTLAAKGHRGTFFVIGQRARKHPDLVREMVQCGHAVENHSGWHSPFTNLRTPKMLAAELEDANAVIAQSTGVTPRFFRPPVGLLSPRITRGAKLAGLDLCGWTGSGRDGVSWRSVDDAVARLEPHLHPGAILVLHDGLLGKRTNSIAIPVLAKVLDLLERKGLRSVTLAALLAPDAGGA